MSENLEDFLAERQRVLNIAEKLATEREDLDMINYHRGSIAEFGEITRFIRERDV
jgi:hypothetical protein